VESGTCPLIGKSARQQTEPPWTAVYVSLALDAVGIRLPSGAPVRFWTLATGPLVTNRRLHGSIGKLNHGRDVALYAEQRTAIHLEIGTG
jgi:hypothetical protein